MNGIVRTAVISITADDLRAVRASPDYADRPDHVEAETIKAAFRARRSERHPFFLTGEELNQVFQWKLRGAHERTAFQRDRNTEFAYRAVTEAVFRIVGPDTEYESVVRLGLLSALAGVGVPLASAVLALTEPDRYCVVDRRGWRAIFGKERESFTPFDYVHYLGEVARLAAELGWPIQETDAAVREYDRRRGRC